MKRVAWAQKSLLALAPLLVASCGTRSSEREGEVILYVDTDAPLPHRTTTPPGEVPPLFDRLRIEIFRRGEATPCRSCSREFPIDRETVDAGQASIGIPESTCASGCVARVRLTRAASLDHDEPRLDSTIDHTVAIPAVGSGQTVATTVFLPLGDVARPKGSLQAPLPAVLGPMRARPMTPQPKKPCKEPHDSSLEACVPGGTFWMGDPQTWSRSTYLASDRQRVVRLSPFYVDLTEVTVAQFRKYVETTGAQPPASRPTAPPGYIAIDPKGLTENCTWDRTDDVAVSCVTWEQARAYCGFRGRVLPTEAQLEYLQGGTEGHRYVWGDDDESCRGTTDEERLLARSHCSYEPSVIGSHRDDVFVAADGARVVDVTGNLGEFALDELDAQDGPCWGTGLFVDPRCTVAGLAGYHEYRGGSVRPDRSAVLPGLRAAIRYGLPIGVQADTVGFRCVRPG